MLLFQPMILDERGVPFSTDRFSQEPGVAHEFMEYMEANSYRVVPDWREMSEEEILTEATVRLHILENDLQWSQTLKHKDRLN